MKIIALFLRIIAAIILLQTLYFKFTAHEESVILFTKLGVEPWGRIAAGIVELVVSIFLLIPRTVLIGAVLGLGLMIGAILLHISIIGIESNNDGGTLFILALITFLCCAINIYYHRNQFFKSMNKLLNQ
ncbi:MAG: DoxX family protein [Chitinophagaceae bacterium]